ncbi:MAG: hypothetical protein AAF715_01315 [Myxococcota bacterium]
MRFFVLVVLTLAGCDLDPPPRGGPGTAPATTTTMAPSASVSAVAAPNRGARSGRSPSPRAARSAAANFSDVPTKLSLSTGATVTIPPPARVRTGSSATKQLPGLVKQAKVFEMGNDKRLLMVNELDREGKPCGTLIDEQRAKMESARVDQNPERLALRRQQSAEVVSVDGHDVLLGMAMHKGVSATDDEPFVGSASAIMCRDDHYLLVMFMARTEEAPGAPKKLLLDVVRSFEPPAG